MRYHIFLSAILMATTASAQGTLDNLSRIQMASGWHKQANAAEILKKSYANNIHECEAFIVLADGYDSSEIQQYGVDIMAEKGGVVIVRGTTDIISKISESPLAAKVSLASYGRLLLDNARAGIGADDIMKGAAPFSSSYTGKGVIVGIYDGGVDPNHVNFTDTDGKSRVKRIFQYDSNGACKEFNTEQDIKAFTTDDPQETHGTHTLGCMTGSFNDTGGRWARYDEERKGSVITGQLPNPFYGIAPQSDIAIACGSLSDAAIMAGVTKIAEYAKAEGKPAVINISIGYNAGAHDGTDPITMFLDALADDAVICIAAGNDGNKPISLVRNYSEDNEEIKTFIVPQKGSQLTGQLDIWSDSDKPFEAIPVIYDMAANKVVYSYTVKEPTDVICVTTSDLTKDDYIHDEFFDKTFAAQSGWIMAATDNNSGNKRFQFSMQYILSYNKNFNSDARYRFGIIIRGHKGQRVDVTNFTFDSELSSLGLDGWTTGTPEFSISSMACGKKTIVVGAWNSRTTIPLLSKKFGTYPENAGYTLGDIAPFSSYGTLIDGRSLPTVCAPGTGIISSISTPYVTYTQLDQGLLSAQLSNGGRMNYWQSLDGTSMATPIVAGAIALWLEANPYLTSSEIRNIITETATKDQFWTDETSTRWGAGKFNALEGLKKVLGLSNVAKLSADNNRPIINRISEWRYEIHCPTALETLINVYDSTGRLIKKIHTPTDSAILNLEDVSRGVYIISVNGTQGIKIAKI